MFEQWLDNAVRRGVPDEEIDRIRREHGIGPASFAILETLPVFTDPDKKSYFLLPRDISGEDAASVVLMTYIVNAGTDYGTADSPANASHDRTPTPNDFSETPYSSAEISRISRRQAANWWSYAQDVGFMMARGAGLVTTPNGILMGLGGGRLVSIFAAKGGTTWGDIFRLNIDRPMDPAVTLENIVTSGSMPISQDPSGTTNHWLDLDRLLHHEEIHAEQWAHKGYYGFLLSYAWQGIKARGDGRKIPLEQQAGLADGGYVSSVMPV